MSIKLQVQKDRTIGEVQYDFNRAYPFLKIEMFHNEDGKAGAVNKERLGSTVILKAAGLLQEGEIEIADAMTVGQLEKYFKDSFGMIVQVSRKLGTIWLETTMTDSWTLKQQNEHGLEFSTHTRKPSE